MSAGEQLRPCARCRRHELNLYPMSDGRGLCERCELVVRRADYRGAVWALQEVVASSRWIDATMIATRALQTLGEAVRRTPEAAQSDGR